MTAKKLLLILALISALSVLSSTSANAVLNQGTDNSTSVSSSVHEQGQQPQDTESNLLVRATIILAPTVIIGLIVLVVKSKRKPPHNTASKKR